MKIGLFYEWPNPALRDWKRLFEEGIEQIQYAEDLGFDFVLIAEHHFSNYGMSPAPLLQAMAIAERTKRIRIGTAVLALPISPPLRLAEEIAVLDNLTDGRFFCGVGRGYQPHEFARFGVTVEESRERFNESLDVMLQAWSQDTSFTYNGRYVQVPEPTVVWPKPLQKPHPPLWVAGASAGTLQLAAERDIVPITSGFSGPEAISEATAQLLRFRRAAGRPVDTWELGAQTICHVAESTEAARALAGHARWQNRAGRSLTRLEVTDGRAAAAPYPGEPDDESFWEALFYGDPQRVTSKYLALNDAGATFASAWMMVGDIDHAQLMRSIRLMGEEVLPALHTAQPPRRLVDELLEREAAPNALAPGATPSD